ncbi:FkbM family methyltransferase [Patescibacteria group bacterium]|nr:FkbM family methyltransferase [Patescibacteria group bacterium]MCL5114559.1 FkbM family methyltransferase [Patescibacteria group bacterium]
MQRSVPRVIGITEKLLGRKIQTVFEMGANDCNDTVGFSKLLPGAEIYAFECNSTVLPKDREVVGGLKNVTLVEKAVSDREGMLEFFPTTNGNTGASSLFKESASYNIEKYNQIKTVVESTTIAHFAAQEGIDGVDLLWMDMQGAELVALKGAGKFLSRVKIIHAEAEFREIYEGQPLFGAVKKYLEDNGFVLYGFTHFGRYACDAIFVNESIPVSLLRRKFVYPFYEYLWKYVEFARNIFVDRAKNIQPSQAG